MAKNLDREWLLRKAGTDETRVKIESILNMRERALKEHLFYTSDEIIVLDLGRQRVYMRECAAPASLEVYCEIFKENDHFLHKDFYPSQEDFVVDIGANEGFYALRVAADCPGARIISIEPNPFAFEILSMNVEHNRLHNIILVDRAVSSDGQSVDMEFIRQVPSIGGAKLRDVDRPWLREEIIEKRRVDSVTVEQVMSTHGLHRIDILKIDVEGMEDEISESLSPISRKIGKIIVERHSKDLRNVVTDTLTGMGFELVYEEDPGFERYYGDLYFINTSLPA